jgi:outer membrane murein-binding lipoprotein Lpp
MAITVITPADLGTGLKVEAQKVVVDTAALSIPVDVKLSGVSVDKAEKKMKFILSDGTEIEQSIADFLTVDTDTKIVSGSYASNKITLVDSEGANVEIDLATLVTEVKDAAATKAGELVNAAKTELDGKVSAVDAKVDALSPKVTTLESKVQALEGKTDLEPKVTTLESKVQALENKKATGIEVKSLGEVSLGYLVSASDVQAA